VKDAFTILGVAAMQILGQGTNSRGFTPLLIACALHCTMVQANWGSLHSSPIEQVDGLSQGL
jgi:hypothetical protein